MHLRHMITTRLVDFCYKPVRWVFALGLMGVLPLVLLTPPLQVADEPQHFERAYQISRLDLVGHVNGDAAGAMLPTSLSDLVRRSLGTLAIDSPRLITPRPLTTTLSGLSRPLDPERVRFTDFRGAAPYSPLPYLPQASAIALGRLFGIGPLALLYAARFANALTAIVLLALAVRTAPMARAAVAFAGLMPMALYQYASASPDAMTIASALLFTATAMRATAQSWTGRTALAAAVLGAIFCSHKPVYAPMLLAGLAPVFTVTAHRVRTVVTMGFIVLVALGATAGWWFVANRGLMLTRTPGTDLHAQITFVFAQPVMFLLILLANLLGQALQNYIGMVGVIGWSAMKLPSICYGIALAGIVLAVLIRDPHEPAMPRRTAAWQFLLVASGVLLVETALYLTWSPVGSRFIDGIQGRYFLPLLGPPLFALHTLLRLPNDEDRSRRYQVIVPALAAAQILILNVTVASAFSVF